jgi:hypothetical protein
MTILLGKDKEHDGIQSLSRRGRMYGMVPQSTWSQLDSLARRPHPLLVADEEVRNGRLQRQIKQQQLQRLQQ